MNRKQWIASLRSGRQMLCTYRWYWNDKQPGPPNGQLCTILHVKATQLIYSTPDSPKNWMRFPKASELKATETGFELYFSKERATRSGAVMSRYEWVRP